MKDRTLLMIPGPIEFEPEVLGALGSPTASHVAPGFVEIFGQAIEMTRKVWQAPSGQPFIIAGSGTLAMEIPIANMIEPGDKVLVLSTGYFGERYAEMIKCYGAEVKILRSSIGGILQRELIEGILQRDSYKLLTFTHVDTSTAVRLDPKMIGELGQKHGVLTVLDGVCSVAGERIYQEDWGLDVVLTASQKAIGVPPGLALLVAGTKAMKAWRQRKTPVTNYYADWNNWLPVMEAYENRKPSYFGTPPVNLICAYYTSLKQILAEGMENRFERHLRIARACRAGLKALELSMVPAEDSFCASTLSAPCYPGGVSALEFLPAVKKAGVVLAGGLHPDIKSTYFRIGHMGAVKPGDVLATIGAIETALKECNYFFDKGAGVAAVQLAMVNKEKK